MTIETKTKIQSILKGLLIAVAGATFTYLTPIITGLDYSFEFQGVVVNFTPYAVAFWSVLVNVVRKFLPTEQK